MAEWQSLVGVLTLAFGLGLVHALDADHILAVSTLASRKNGEPASPWHFCLRWALGHGLILFVIGGAVLVVGSAVPTALSVYAEAVVGAVLVIMGVWVFFDLRRQSLSLAFHRHAPGPQQHQGRWHAHWHRPSQRSTAAHDHSATLVGALHGAAGSAPLLAIVPLVTHHSAWWGMLYLALFSVGVLASMLLFGGVLGVFFQRLVRWDARLVDLARAGIAGGSVLAGCYVLLGVV